MKLKIRLIWRKTMTDFNGVVNEGISISLRRRNILLRVCRAACEHFWFSKPIFRREQAKARGRRQNMREMWTLVR